jgi:hypothetical protein
MDDVWVAAECGQHLGHAIVTCRGDSSGVLTCVPGVSHCVCVFFCFFWCLHSRSSRSPAHEDNLSCCQVESGSPSRCIVRRKLWSLCMCGSWAHVKEHGSNQISPCLVLSTLLFVFAVDDLRLHTSQPSTDHRLCYFMCLASRKSGPDLHTNHPANLLSYTPIALAIFLGSNGQSHLIYSLT